MWVKCSGVTRYKAFSSHLLFQNGPELLPRREMLLLLTRVIATGSPRLQVSPQEFCLSYISI